MTDRVLAFLRACLGPVPPGPDDVEAEALALYHWQVTRSPAYASFAAGRQPRSLDEIPAVPVALLRDVPFTCFPPSEARYRFETSGTTTGRPGIHRLETAAAYDLGSAGWFHRRVPGAPARCLSLVPSPVSAPTSSLSHMIGLLFPHARFLADGSGCFDPTEAWEALATARGPVFLATTGLVLAHLLDAPGSADLPEGSLVLVTGGFKGRSHVEDAVALHAEAGRRLGRAAYVGEYGMTELSSQGWTDPLPFAAVDPEGPFHLPPWLVPVAVDPGSGAPLPPGGRGQLRFVDLANVESVLALETMDEGTVLPGGSILLHGRLPGAPARGCSLTAEEAAALARRPSRERGG
ncbi:MAG: hypothetical protein JXB39_14305 [Deltaproteobacteria bacterium]|nr:hypothetical protein [Deltaproteobacteria bacterium]